MRLRGLGRALPILVAALASLAYFALERLGDGGWVLLKAAAIVPLALFGWRGGRPRDPRFAAALAVHALGDLLLEAAPFLAAMAAFASGHLLYAMLFATARRPWEEAGAGAKLRLGLLALVGALLLGRLTPGLEGALRLAVPLYALLLLTMAASAQLSSRGAPWVALGALLYVASDALLALELFAVPPPGSAWLVWPAYWSGQAAIAIGWLRNPPLSAPGPVP